MSSHASATALIVRSGDGCGREGVVVGKHEAFHASKHVLVHLDDVRSSGSSPATAPRARERPRHERRGPAGIACHSLGPELWEAWAPERADGRCRCA